MCAAEENRGGGDLNFTSEPDSESDGGAAFCSLPASPSPPSGAEGDVVAVVVAAAAAAAAALRLRRMKTMATAQMQSRAKQPATAPIMAVVLLGAEVEVESALGKEGLKEVLEAVVEVVVELEGKPVGWEEVAVPEVVVREVDFGLEVDCCDVDSGAPVRIGPGVGTSDLVEEGLAVVKVTLYSSVKAEGPQAKYVYGPGELPVRVRRAVEQCGALSSELSRVRTFPAQDDS